MRERVEYWQEIASRALLELRTERLSQEPFFGMLDYQPLGTLDVLHLHSSAQRVIRGPLEIARSSEERFFICSNLSGRCILHQGDQETVSRPGDLEIISGNHPTHITFGTDYRRIIIPVPRKMLAPRLVNPERLTMLV
ncbi:MAG TPA: hypothetical protein VK447_12815, partial [Myxococcaceae bacterium]|nr:hypothetical protein [Myxococcaceae bacterium]